MKKPAKSHPRAKRPRAPRAGRRYWIVAIAVVAAVAGAAAVVGSFTLHRILSTGKVPEWVNAHPEKLRLEYASADGWTPWAVHVHGLELRSRDPNVEWWMRIEDATFSFAPLPLLAHRFHVTRLRGTGLAYRLRLRQDPAKTEAAHFAAVPSIPGFPARPQPPGEEPVPGGGKVPASRVYSIQVTDIRLEGIHEIWVELYRLHGGTGTLTGSFSLLPGERAQVGPATVALAATEFSIAKHTVLQPATFESTATIRTFDPRVVRGNAVWPYISGRVRLGGDLTSISFLNYFLDGGEPHLSGAPGSGKAELDIERGHGKGTVSLDGRAFSAKYKDANLRGNLTARMRLTDWDFEHERIVFPGSRVELTNVMAGEPGPDSRDWWGNFDLTTAEIRSGRVPPFQTTVALHCRDARPLFTLFRVGLPGWTRGLLKLEGFEGKARVGLGPNFTRLDDFEAAGGAFHLRGRYLARKTSNGAFLLESGPLDVGVEIQDGKSSLKLIGAKKRFEDQPRP